MILAVAPALPLHTAGKYVAAAYIVFVVVLIIYLGIMAIRTARTNRQLEELRREVAARRSSEQPGPHPPEMRGSSTDPEPERSSPDPEPEREPAL